MEVLDEGLVKEIERFIFEAWDMGLSGNDVIGYACSMARQPSFHVDPVLKNLIERMSDD
jgi:hypothetical protein